jgi:uncharacterized protein
MTEREITDNPEASRFELHIDGEFMGWVDYRLHDQVMTIPHVQVSPRLRGQGVSAPFLDDVLAEIRSRGLKIVPTCGYARTHVADRPELHDLLA